MSPTLNSLDNCPSKESKFGASKKELQGQKSTPNSFVIRILTSNSFALRILRRKTRYGDDSKDSRGEGGTPFEEGKQLPNRKQFKPKQSPMKLPSQNPEIAVSRYSVRGTRCFYTLLSALVLSTAASASDCLPIREAKQHVGETKCVTGKVLRVKVGARGVHFVDFCEDQMACPFTVVVFPHDLKDVGDVRRLAGQVIEIHGPVKLYDGRAEIILNRVSQLTGGSTLIPPLPKNYDVEKQGHYSAGRLHPPKKPAKTYSTPNSGATYGNETDVGGDPPQ